MGPKEKIKKKFFGAGPDTRFDAHIWLGPEAFFPYVQGHTLAFQVLLRRAIRLPRESRYLIFPILFNFRQAVELQLKNIICLTGDFEKGGLSYPKGHDIKLLWKTAKKLVGESFAPSTWRQAVHSEALILELDRLDKGSDKFRFPEDIKGKRHFDYQGKSINIPAIRKDLPKVLDYLDTIAFGLRNSS